MFETLHKWLERKIRVDVYELRGNAIVATGWPKQRIPLADIRVWQSFYIGGGVPSICVEFSDGRRVDFSDRHEQLFQILRHTAKDKELPFFTE